MCISSKEIVNIFIDFFKSKNHIHIDSSSLIPKNDNSILFTNSGMNQFKNIFLGLEKPKHKRVVTLQRCVRAGGKHNDINQVGYTTRHHTFFYMLGNFSFGDYFKSESIELSLTLLTNKNYFNINKDKLLITVYYKDEESYNIWLKMGIPYNKIIKIKDNNKIKYSSDNFWQMSDTGPCGPSSEIFYDLGENNINSENSNLIFKKNSNRYLEIWNLVFIEFNKFKNGNLYSLPFKSIDTGMGLERISSILQKVKSNYDIDIFKNLINKISKIINFNNINNSSIKIIADHIRSCLFIINDGVIPSNESQGYVLKKIIRRAICHGKILGIKFPFFYKIIDFLLNSIDIDINNINFDFNYIKKIILSEENKFEETINKSILILNKEIVKIKNSEYKILNGDIIFYLYDTYGLPLEIIKNICFKNNILFDEYNFNILMLRQKKKSKI